MPRSTLSEEDTRKTEQERVAYHERMKATHRWRVTLLPGEEITFYANSGEEIVQRIAAMQRANELAEQLVLENGGQVIEIGPDDPPL